MNKFSFCRAFKGRFGRSFVSYLNSVRMRHAVELLRNPDLNVSEIALFLHYDCLEYFSRTFKKAYGMSPREYRKKISL